MFHELQQLRGVVKLAQVDAMSHSLAIGHDAHLQSTHRHVILHRMSLFFFSSHPSTFAASQSVEDVVVSNGADVTPCSIYSRQRTSAAVEDVTYNRRAPRRQDFPVFPSGNIHKPRKPDQCNHNRNRPRIQTEVQERKNTLKVKLSRA